MASTAKKRRSAFGGFIELVVTVAIAIGLAFLIQAFIVKPYRIPSVSMVPTLRVGQRILAKDYFQESLVLLWLHARATGEGWEPFRHWEARALAEKRESARHPERDERGQRRGDTWHDVADDEEDDDFDDDVDADED